MASIIKGRSEDRSASGDDPPVKQPRADELSDAQISKAKGNDVEDEKDDLPGDEPPPEKKERAKSASGDSGRTVRPAKASPSFFTIYKSGQGYWTRMGTAIGAALLGVMLSYTIYDKVGAFRSDNSGKKLGIEVGGAFLLVWCGVAWWMMNKPANADFLIATDSEMKKVNWTSRKELYGSTRIVIIFMFAIAAFLFAVDELWGWLMYLAKVLTIKPPPFS